MAGSQSLAVEPHMGCPTPHPQPQTPHLEEDLKEVLRSEAGIELIIEDEARPEKQKRKAGVSGRWGWRSPSYQAGQFGPREVEPWGGGESGNS